MVFNSSTLRTLLAAALIAGSAPLTLGQDNPPKPELPRGDKPDRPERGDRPPEKREGEGDPRDPRRHSWGPGSSRGPRFFEVLTPEELMEVVAAVEARNPDLAKKVREKFSDLFRRPPQLTDEQLKKAIVVFEERMPEMADRLKEGLESNPERIKAVISAQWYRLYKVIELRETDRKMYDAQTAEIRRGFDVHMTARKLRKATEEKDESQMKALREELRVKLRAQHEAQKQLQNLEIARLDERIARIRDDMAKDDKNVEKRIEEQIKKMLTWPPTPPQGPPGGAPPAGEPISRPPAKP